MSKQVESPPWEAVCFVPGCGRQATQWTVPLTVSGQSGACALYSACWEHPEGAVENLRLATAGDHSERLIERAPDADRSRQAEAAMPLIGGLLDAWDQLPLDLRGEPEMGELWCWVRALDDAMETLEPIDAADVVAKYSTAYSSGRLRE